MALLNSLLGHEGRQQCSDKPLSKIVIHGRATEEEAVVDGAEQKVGDHFGIEVRAQFSFGFGLSYTSFDISKLEVTPKSYGWNQAIKVKFFVENTGTRSGAEVAQVYVGMPASLGEPPKRLVAFQKVFLKPGEKRHIQISINPQGNNHPFSYWDSQSQKWTIAAGKYKVYVGNSSNNIVASDEISIGTKWQDREYRSEERQAREDWEKGDQRD